jgi:proline dehydrogenase
METSRISEKLTSRFVAGLRLEDGLRVSAALKNEGILSSLDHLGENVRELAEAEAARDAYLAALDRIAKAGLDTTVSVKLTALGLDLSEDAARRNAAALVARAKEIGSRIEMDMESSEYADRTLAILREMHAQGGPVRAVIQAYLYRSEEDINELCREGIPVRLVKGAYQEPPELAYPGKQDVDASYIKLMKKLLDDGAYPAIATHDEAILDEAIRYVRERKYSPDRFEFQMLYGIRRALQRRIVKLGFRLRVYVPYGSAWYPYFMRRLAERPANVLFLARNLFRG